MKKRFILGVTLVVLPSFIQAQTGKARLLFGRNDTHCQTPKWSPDGKEIAVETFSPKKDLRGVVVVPVSNPSSVTEVTAGQSKALAKLGEKKAVVGEFAWAPDRSTLTKPYIFSSNARDNNFDLYADGSWLTTNKGNDGNPDWSTDGRFIAYVAQGDKSGDIYLIEVEGDIEKPIRATFFDDSTELRPQWASEGNTLLFTRSSKDESGRDIGLIGDASRPQDTTRMVVTWSSDEIRPSLSPDGRKIAFYSNRKQKNKKKYDLWVVDVNEGDAGARLLASDVVVADEHGPVWLPDNNTLLYVKSDFKRDNPIAWIRISGKEGGVLKTNTQLNSDLALHNSDSGLRLAFTTPGKRNDANKTWRKVFVLDFNLADLK